MNRREYEAFEAGIRAFHANRSVAEMPAATKADATLAESWTKGWRREMETLQRNNRSVMETMSRRPASRCEMSSRGPGPADGDADTPGPGPC